NWALTDASGNQLGASTSANTQGTGGIHVYSLAEGTYTFTVEGIGAATGNYRFDLLDLADAPEFSDGEVIQRTLADGRETVAGYIDVAEGERLSYDLISRSAGGAFNAQIRILDSANNAVLDSNNTDRTSDILSAGRYWVL